MSEREKVVRCMREHLDKPYCSPTQDGRCWDCSGLVSTCLARVGIDISRGSAEQWNRTKHQKIPTAQAQPGDLVFWGPSSNASHVGVVVGPGRVISAMNEKDDIKETSLLGQYGALLLGVVSFLPKSNPEPSSTEKNPKPSSPSSSGTNRPKVPRRRNRRKKLEHRP